MKVDLYFSQNFLSRRIYSCTMSYPSCILPVYQSSGSVCTTRTSNMFIIPPNLRKYPLSIILIDTFSTQFLILMETLQKQQWVLLAKHKKNLHLFIGKERMPPKLHFTVTTVPVSCSVFIPKASFYTCQN